MIIALKTVDRTPKRNMVQATLASMFAKDPSVERYVPIRIITDGEDMSFLGPWAFDSRLAVETTDDKRERRDYEGASLRVVRADVRGMQAVPDGEDIFLLEDDLEFAPRWLQRTEAIVERIRADIGSRCFMLAVYTPFEFVQHNGVRFDFAEREGYCACIRPTYYGSQAIYYGAEAIPIALRDMKQLGLVGKRLPNDMVVKYTSIHRDVPLLAAVPSLVQHVGAESTWSQHETLTMHRSPTFRDEDERPRHAREQAGPTAQTAGDASLDDLLERLEK